MAKGAIPPRITETIIRLVIKGACMKKITMLAICFVALPMIAQAATYYVCGSITSCNANGGSGWSGTPSDSNAGTSKGSPLLTIGAGVRKMASGDTLVVGNGTYSGNANRINSSLNGTQIPSGTSSKYTTVQADVDGYALIQASGGTAGYTVIAILGNNPIDSSGFSPDESGNSQQYIVFRGFVVQGDNSGTNPIEISAANHIKLINVGSFDSASGNNVTIAVGFSEYILLEGCYAWGNGRAKILFFHNPYSIMRNCVARQDYLDVSADNGGAGDPMSVFDVYSSPSSEIQNCIAVDGNNPSKWVGFDEDEGSFCAATTSSSTFSGPVNVTNSVSINNDHKFAESDWNTFDPQLHITNTVGWAHAVQKPPSGVSSLTFNYGSLYLNQCTFGSISKSANSDGSQSAYFEGYASGNGTGTTSITNNIMVNFNASGANGGALFGSSPNLSVSYNDIYNSGTTDGATNTITTNPLSSCLLYPVRTEAGCPLAGQGKSGATIGANIQYQYGAPGTLYGDAGYNLYQNGTNGQATVPMWPFPNEAIIKKWMCQYSNNGVTGNRGFCLYSGKDGVHNSLTTYIWEYLGNQIPANIYGNSSGTTLSAPTNLHIVQ